MTDPNRGPPPNRDQIIMFSLANCTALQSQSWGAHCT